MRNPDKLKLDELLELREQIDGLIEERRAGVPPRYNRPRKSVRKNARDWRTAEHLYRARILSTRQLARLEYPNRDGIWEKPRVRFAQSRLYELMSKANLVKSLPNRLEAVPGLEGTGTAWELTRATFKTLRSDPSQDYPDPLSNQQIRHLVAVNELYVLLHELFKELPRIEPSDWRWVGEPRCHRPYGGAPGARGRGRIGYAGGFKLKPDAEIVLFDEVVFLLERQTARAKEKPEALHDKVFNYHRYENSPERRRDGRVLVNLWACDADRDRRTVLQAAQNHPTKTAKEARMEERWDKRMPLEVGSPQWAAELVRDTALQLLERRTAP